MVGAKPRARHPPSQQASPQKGRHAPLHHLLRPTGTLWPESPDALFPSGETKACTFEEEVGLGQVQLVPEGDAGVLHPCAGLELHTHLQLEGPW